MFSHLRQRLVASALGVLCCQALSSLCISKGLLRNGLPAPTYSTRGRGVVAYLARLKCKVVPVDEQFELGEKATSRGPIAGSLRSCY